jgi:hypothetical protein
VGDVASLLESFWGESACCCCGGCAIESTEALEEDGDIALPYPGEEVVDLARGVLIHD